MSMSKSLQITNAGEGVEKRELSYTVGGNVNWYSHYGEQYGGSSKVKHTFTIFSNQSAHRYLPQREKKGKGYIKRELWIIW